MSSAVVEDDPMPEEWSEFLEGINFNENNEKIYKILAMVNEKGRGKEYLVWWKGKSFEESTWTSITHLKKFYTEEALLKINEFKSKEAFKAKLESASRLGEEEKWKFLENASLDNTKAYNPSIFEQRADTDSDDGLGKMPELNDREFDTLMGIKGKWGGRKSRKKKRKSRKKKRKTRKKKRKTRKKTRKTRKKRRKTRKKKRKGR